MPKPNIQMDLENPGSHLGKNLTAEDANTTGAVMESDFNTKGDLLSASANDTPVILAVGANDGAPLVVASGETTGLKWGGPYWHEYNIPANSFAPGASGATWTDPGANTLGGWLLNLNTEFLYFHAHVEADWNGASDLKLEVWFELAAAGTSEGDTVDIKALFKYKGVAEVVQKTQTVEVATVVDDAAQYTMFKAEFTVNWDLTDHVVQAADVFSITLNLETDTSEVDAIYVNFAEFKYQTAYQAVEV